MADLFPVGGDATQGSNLLGATRIYYQKFVPTEDGITTSLKIWLFSQFGSTDTEALCGLYDHDGVAVPNEPSDLIIEGSSQLISSAAAAVSTTIELLFRAVTVTDDATMSSLADAA